MEDIPWTMIEACEREREQAKNIAKRARQLRKANW